MSRNILVTGGGGQLGMSIKSLTKKYNYNFFLKNKTDLDITNKNEFKKFCDTKKIDTIINCAAYTNVEKAEDEFYLANKINNLPLKHISKTCSKNNITLIHISTDFVFDGNNTVPYVETNKTNPINIYGKTKLEGEKTILKENPARSVIIRTSWLYSEYGNNFMKTILKISNNKKIKVVNNQFGSPTYAKDLADDILKNLSKINNLNTEIYHYSNYGKTSWYNFAKQILGIKNIDCEVTPISSIDFKTKAKRPSYSVLDTEKIEKKFNLRINKWQESLKKCLKNIK